MKGKRLAAGCGLVSATYFYFLLFAQFSFLKLVRAQFPIETDLRVVMGCMGVSGMAGSLLCAWSLQRTNGTSALRLGLVLCACVSVIAPQVHSFISFCVIAAMIGASLAILTISLASGLKQYAGVELAGFVAGIGTGAAYFLCNVPWIFNAAPTTQAYLVAITCLAATALTCPSPVALSVPATHAERLSWPLFAGSIVALLALVWLDSAAFLIIQQTAQLKSTTWGGDATLWLNAGVHLSAAVIAGVVTDRGRYREVLVTAFTLLALGAMLLATGSNYVEYASLLYCAGVSLYSTILVALPTKAGGNIPWRSGWLYAIAGWFGSAMGIGMAQDLHTIPGLFLVISAVVLLIALFGRELASRRIFLLVGLPFVPGVIMNATHETVPIQSAIARGRAVYIEEGCMHCHSQFVRKGFVDEELWGPYVQFENILKEQPPLIGNRRLGPDLLNVGNRRSRDWLKVHLISPASLQPETIMPAYPGLFSDGRGEDLLDYLVNLGQGRAAERLGRIALWKFPPGTQEINEKSAIALFQEACAVCHGADADGNGALRGFLSTVPRNLIKDSLTVVREGTEYERDDMGRVIKFGISGRAMAGHEYYEPEELLGLVRLIQHWRRERK